MKKNLLSLIVILLLLSATVFALLSCNNSNGPSASTTGSSDSETQNAETEAEPIDLCIVEGGVCNYTLVASEDATSTETKALMKLRSALSDLTGATPQMQDDWIPKGSEHDSSALEILIGKTNYAETREILNNTSYGSYQIAVVGNKIVLAAWSGKALESGMDALIDIFAEAVTDNALIINSSRVKGTLMVDDTIDGIPVVPNLELDHVYDANNAFEAIYNKATPEHFNAYIEKLDREGYVKYAEHTRGKVTSAIYTDEKNYIYNIFYEGGYNQLCVIVEDYDKDMLPPKQEPYKKVCETLFAQVGVEHRTSGYQNGMCYIWRLEDGRFIIMDGGFNVKIGATNLLKTLQEMAVDPNNIVIASWIITHFHSDHVGTLTSFVQNCLYNATIESLLINLPTLEQSKLSDMSWNDWNKISAKLLPYNPDLVVYKAHPGQIYHFANAEVEILYTLEMTAPDALTYYNTCSLITDVRFGEFDMMMLGDCSEVTTENLLANYGEALASEVVQVAHHGYDGGSTNLYRKIDPEFVFWPAGTVQYNNCESTAMESSDEYRNAYFFMEGTNIKLMFPAKYTVVIMEISGNKFTQGWRYDNVDAVVNQRYTYFSLAG